MPSMHRSSVGLRRWHSSVPTTQAPSARVVSNQAVWAAREGVCLGSAAAVPARKCRQVLVPPIPNACASASPNYVSPPRLRGEPSEVPARSVAAQFEVSVLRVLRARQRPTGMARGKPGRGHRVGVVSMALIGTTLARLRLMLSCCSGLRGGDGRTSLPPETLVGTAAQPGPRAPGVPEQGLNRTSTRPGCMATARAGRSA